MSGTPQNTVFANGQSVLLDVNLNALTQTTFNVAQVRLFTGIPGMALALGGIATINDGGGGLFFWENGNAFVDDNGLTTIIPYGVTSGAWIRTGLLFSPGSALTSLNVTGAATIGGNVSIGGAETVNGALSVGGAMTVGGSNVSVAGNFEVGGSQTVGGNSSITGNATVLGTHMQGATTIIGALQVDGALDAGAGNSGVAGNFGVVGNLLVGGNIETSSGVVALGSGPFWSTGSATPSATAPQGSIYSRSGAGTVGSTLYVSQGMGVWNPVSGV